MLFFKGLDHVKESETYSLTAKRKGRKKNTHTQTHKHTKNRWFPFPSSAKAKEWLNMLLDKVPELQLGNE